MAITIKLDDLLHDRRMTLTELADRIGMTLANLSILKTGKARAIRFSTLNAICGALSCQPGDILRFEPGRRTRARVQQGELGEFQLDGVKGVIKIRGRRCLTTLGPERKEVAKGTLRSLTRAAGLTVQGFCS